NCATDADCGSGGACRSGACVMGCPAKLDPTTLEPTSCLRCCADTPLQLFVANRAPPSLVLGRVRTVVVDSGVGGGAGSGAVDVVEVFDTVPLSLGPSKVALGKVIGVDGQLHTRVFAVTFDSRFIFSYDPDASRVDAVIRTGRGPHAIAFDACTSDCGPGE